MNKNPLQISMADLAHEKKEPATVVLYDTKEVPLREAEADESSLFDLFQIIACNQSIRKMLERKREEHVDLLADPNDLDIPMYITPNFHYNDDETRLPAQEVFYCLNVSNPRWDGEAAALHRDQVFQRVGECFMVYVGPTGKDISIIFWGRIQLNAKPGTSLDQTIYLSLLEELRQFSGVIHQEFKDDPEWADTQFSLNFFNAISHDPGIKIRAELLCK